MVNLCEILGVEILAIKKPIPKTNLKFQVIISHDVIPKIQVYNFLGVSTHCVAPFSVIAPSDDKVDVYYEQILKLANCLQHKANDSLLTNFFQA